VPIFGAARLCSLQAAGTTEARTSGPGDRRDPSDKTAPPKQRHTAKRIFERLRIEHGYAGGYAVVKDYVRLARTRSREVFVPLAHPPGHAQVDFGECIGVIGGVRMKLHVFCFDLPHSDACFLKAYPAETTEAFLDGHVSAFDFLAGFRSRFSTTTPRSRRRGFWATASGGALGPSPNSSVTISSRTGSVDRAKATTRARSKRW
jgi:hypothetical protein